MRPFFASVGVCIFLLGCGGGGGSSATSDVGRATTVASVQGLAGGQAAYATYTSISTVEANSSNKQPSLNTIYPMGFDGLYFEFTSFSLSGDGSATGNLNFFDDAAGSDQVGTGTLTVSVSGSTTTTVLSFAMNKGPLPISGSVTVTQTNGQPPTMSGTITDKSSGAVSTVQYNFITGVFNIGIQYGGLTLSGSGTLAGSNSASISNATFSATPGGLSGNFTENPDGSGSVEILTSVLGSISAFWTANQTLTISYSGGKTVTIPGACQAPLY